MIITRFAPSPTGNLHIGGLRTALFNYLYARINGGKFLLRIEDTDFARNSIDAKEGIIQAFEWTGLDYDGEIEYQSRRMDIYKKYIQKLLECGKAYHCYMTKEELDELREEQKQKGETPRYDRRYRDFKGEIPQGIQPVVRIKAPLEGEIVFEDGIKGEIRISVKELDDFIIARSDGTPTYNFTVAVDDALMEVSDVIRGDDHLSNTPKQIIVYQALEFKIPKFYHIPMILNPQGKKLSKRDGAMGVMDYKKGGYLAEALLNFLVRLGWSHQDDEIFSMQEMLQYFSPKDINSSASAYNQDKLLWLNHHYINQKTQEELVFLLQDFGIQNLAPQVAEHLFCALKERSKTLLEFCSGLQEVLESPKNYDEKMFKKNCNEGVLESLMQAYKILETLDFDVKGKVLEESFQEKAKESFIAKPSQLFLPLRLGLLGKGGGVPIFDAMVSIGKEETIARIQALIVAIRQVLMKN
ncbi:glutamate--tRNA ligase [Helicobacter monodelphidis]|uniref:glutamate--tRNA ligase n=1 Tax=Helicobacter sp. 15-1451 TaxID=2004995 RepID=UPI000DCB6D26|nr:glutamate--tRNA ligase [Helicobacter sp. 15-1451]RAX56747.1 glutamate--tRNA ligase [Helicobacter sp. 15-1451]